MIVTIDGPVASGKSSVARLLAARHGWYYINSGLFFRLIAHVLMHAGYSASQLANVSESDVKKIAVTDIVYSYRDGHEDIAYCGKSLALELKNQEFDQAASLVSTHAVVRDLVLALERNLAQHHNVVIDGRDTGSIVFPDAQVKIYLTADVAVRAVRWQQMMQDKGLVVTSDYALHEVKQRDERDIKRSLAPLIVPAEALVVDATHLNIEQVIDRIDLAVQKALKKGAG